MRSESASHKKKREAKSARLKALVGVEFCACGPINRALCRGGCRDSHTHPQTGVVKCFEMYQIELPRKDNTKKKFRLPRKPPTAVVNVKEQARERYYEKRGQ